MSYKAYGFTENPFELSPDPKFLFPCTSFEQARLRIVQGILNRKGLIVVTGEVGTGKTLLIGQLLGQLPSHVRTAFLFHSTYSYPELLQALFRELEAPIPEGEATEWEKHLLALLGDHRRQGILLAVFIDEAQRLGQPLARTLIALLEKTEWIPEVLQLILVGQPEFLKIFMPLLEGTRPRRKVVEVGLNPLTEEESRAYIHHRLQVAGKSPPGPFTESALNQIIAYAGGIPRKINILGDNALFLGPRVSTKEIDLPVVKEAIANLEGGEKGPLLDPPSVPGIAPSKARLYGRSRKLWGGIFFLVLLIGVGIYLLGPQTPLLHVKRFAGPAFHWRVAEKIPRPEEATPGSPPAGVQEPTPRVSSPRMVQVKKGDNLSRIAMKHYGRYNLSLADWLTIHNPMITDLDLVLVDQMLRLPEPSDSTRIFRLLDGTVFIFLGTYPGREEAERQSRKLASLAAPLGVTPRKLGFHQIGYRLTAGPFPTLEEAWGILNRLKGKNLLPPF